MHRGLQAGRCCLISADWAMGLLHCSFLHGFLLLWPVTALCWSCKQPVVKLAVAACLLIMRPSAWPEAVINRACNLGVTCCAHCRHQSERAIAGTAHACMVVSLLCKQLPMMTFS